FQSRAAWVVAQRVNRDSWLIDHRAWVAGSRPCVTDNFLVNVASPIIKHVASITASVHRPHDTERIWSCNNIERSEPGNSITIWPQSVSWRAVIHVTLE